MRRALAVVTACLLVCVRAASADSTEAAAHQLSTATSDRVRLAAALALAKSFDARAVIALADALGHDDDATVRRVSALALPKMITKRTPDDARSLAITALKNAAASDRDGKVRATAVASLEKVPSPPRKQATEPAGDRPSVFVNIDRAIDLTHRLPSGGSERLMKVVRSNVERTGYATSWPGGLPTSAELTSSRSRGFIVASTVKRIEIARTGSRTQVSCTVAIRIAPWNGKDGGESWEANKEASATGSGKATTGNKDREIQGGVRDCIEAVGDDVTGRQIVPFLKRLASAGS